MKLRVLLICDSEGWILCTIARKLSQLLANQVHITLLVSHSQDFVAPLHRLQRDHDVVHFLSPSDFINWHPLVYRPCVVTLWHRVDWTPFDAHIHRADTLCVGSRQWLERLEGHVPPNLPVRRPGYGLDTHRFVRDPSARTTFLNRVGVPQETLVFGFAGSAQSNEGNRKGLDRMWRCLSRFQQEYPGPFLLRIIGRGWGPSIIPPELQERVYLEPYIESANLPHFYSSLDYYLCTSRVEGVPYPVLEAMSCESVVLSTEVGIVPEIMIDGKNGFLLREGSIERDFLAAMHQTSHDQHLRDRYGRAARATVVQQRSWEVAVSLQEYEEVYTTARQRYALRSPLERFTLHLQSRFALLVHPIQQAVTGGISFVRSKIRLRSRLRNVKLP